jgi:transcriptional regulator with XRE-family HTH domain
MMKINIGNTISELRKKKGLTQEQLANAVGVSTPAVSKWETNTSCPDITLLAPIARALGTNVDTLLNFSPKLSDTQAAEYAAEVAAVSANADAKEALTRMQEILCTYPENPALQFHMASFLSGLKMENETERAAARKHAKDLFEAVINSGDAQFFASAAYLLSALCVEDNETDRAEKLLELIPETPEPGKELVKAALLEKRGDYKQAKQIIQSCLYVAFQKVQMCLSRLMKQEYSPDIPPAVRICEIHKELATLMDYPYSMSDKLFASVYMRNNQPELAADHILSLAQSLSQEVKPWGQTIFSDLDMNAEQMNAMLLHIRKITFDSLLEDKSFKPLAENSMFKAALAMLKDSNHP